MTAALEEGEWSAARPGRTLPPGKTGYPFYRRLGGPQGRSGRAENLVPTAIRSRTVQPVVRFQFCINNNNNNNNNNLTESFHSSSENPHMCHNVVFTLRLLTVKTKRCNKASVGSLFCPKINPHMISDYIISDSDISEAVNVNCDN